jgi:hypothetical protein
MIFVGNYAAKFQLRVIIDRLDCTKELGNDVDITPLYTVVLMPNLVSTQPISSLYTVLYQCQTIRPIL